MAGIPSKPRQLARRIDAAALVFRDALCSCSCVRGKFLEPTASAGNRRDQQGASFGCGYIPPWEAGWLWRPLPFPMRSARRFASCLARRWFPPNQPTSVAQNLQARVYARSSHMSFATVETPVWKRELRPSADLTSNTSGQPQARPGRYWGPPVRAQRNLNISIIPWSTRSLYGRLQIHPPLKKRLERGGIHDIFQFISCRRRSCGRTLL